jgi:hypothetical protein
VKSGPSEQIYVIRSHFGFVNGYLNRIFLCVLGSILLPTASFALEPALPGKARISAVASSSYTGREPVNAINGAGLVDGAHDNELDSTWHSGTGTNPWFRVDFGEARPIRWMKFWNFNWARYTDRGIRQADIYAAATDEPGNPVDNPKNWRLLIEDQQFTRASHWPDYGRNPDRRMPDVIDLGRTEARSICLVIDSNFTESGRGYFGISEIEFSNAPFPEPEPLEPLFPADAPELTLLANPRTIQAHTRFPAPKDGWNLSGYQFVEFELHNPSDEIVSVSPWVFAPNGWGGLGSFPHEGDVIVLEPDERATVLLDLHSRFLGKGNEDFCKVIDPSQIEYAEIRYVLRSGETASPIEVTSIRAVGAVTSPVHDSSTRLLVPEIVDGSPAPGKRVQQNLHVLYLPTDWKPGGSYPIVIEYPGNEFYNQFCYSPGKTEYGRLGWGLTKDLGSPNVAGDGFIWLNLPFVNDESQEQISGWGNPDKTVQYCLNAVSEVVAKYGGDPDAVIFTGFSRGALAANYIGLRTPEIAGLIRVWHRIPNRRAPADKGGWHNMFEGQNNRIDQHYQGQLLCPRGGTVSMGPRAHVDCGYLEDRPDAVEYRKWLVEVLTDELNPLRNDLYNIWPQLDGSLHIAPTEGGGFVTYRPEFRVIYFEERWIPTRQRIEVPSYPLPAWKFGKDELRKDVYQLGEEIVLTEPKITRDGDVITWKFSHDNLDLTALITLPEGECPRIDYEVTTDVAGNFTFAYTGGPSFDLSDLTELWQPLVWDGRRLPDSSFLIPDGHCSIPGCLVESNGTTGVIADPWQFPYEMPHHRNRKFGVTLRSRNGLVQPTVFAPFPGTNSTFRPGQTFSFAVRLVHQPASLTETFEHVARDICGFRDQRENTICSLNTTLENMASFALSKWASFDHANKSSYYPDAKGTVKNVSCLHPLGIALVTDEPRFFKEQAVPIMEYLLSREKFLFATSEQGLSHSQSPTMNLNGPAMPVSELAALHRISGGQTTVFRSEAQRLYAADRMLNMTWVTRGATWQRSLWMYRTTGEKKWLNDAAKKADRYIAERIGAHPTDFAEAGRGTFFEYMTPKWKDLYELYLDTREPRHLRAAHAGARRYAQFVWFYPSVPEGEITVNPSGLAPRRGRPDEDGFFEVAEETVPNWQVSDQGLLCEGNGTAARLGILIATHAPFFLRIAKDTGDEFLRDIARSAVIGRYANFPGYHLNTRFNTAQEKPDFPVHDYQHLKPTTSIHFNHILPHTNLIIDYLYSRCRDLSDGQIEFPAEYAEGYAYLQGRIYGAKPGSFYGYKNVRPWMPAGLVKISDVDVNFVSARSKDGFYIALMNSCDRELKSVDVQLNANRFDELSEVATAKVWMENEPLQEGVHVRNGRFKVSLKPKSITAVHIPGLRPRVQFQDEFGPASDFALENEGESTIAGCKVEASVLTFGPELRWIYAWLRSDQGKPDVDGLELTLTLGDGTLVEQTDDSFPYEFHVELPESAKHAEFTLTPLVK